jgi:hypothetical protein
MKTYVINLPEDTERKTSVERQCGFIGLDTVYTYEKPSGDRALDCFMSHRKIWEMPHEEPYLVLEDDVGFVDPIHFKEDLKTAMEALPEKWSILFLGGVPVNHNISWKPPIHLLDGILYGTHAYVANPAERDTVLSIWPVKEVDVTLSRQMPPGSRFLTTKLLATQLDIEAVGRPLRSKQNAMEIRYKHAFPHTG